MEDIIIIILEDHVNFNLINNLYIYLAFKFRNTFFSSPVSQRYFVV